MCGIIFTAGTYNNNAKKLLSRALYKLHDQVNACKMSTTPCRYGGGPAVNHLYVCHTCQMEIEKFDKRRKSELDMFVRVSVPTILWCIMTMNVFVKLKEDHRVLSICKNYINWVTVVPR